jgi:hypothetical protein
MKGKGIYLIMGILFLCVQVFSAAPTVSLKGTVKTGAGAAIAGAKVALGKLTTYRTTTDAQGAFDLNAPTQVLQQSQKIAQFHFSLAGNALVISPIFEKAQGLVEVFFTNGRKNISIPISGNITGKQIVNLPEFVSGLNIIRVTVGNETITKTLICLDNSNRYLTNDLASADKGGNFVLAKSDATTIVDTLIVSKANYSTKRVTVDAYTKQDLAVTLDTAGAPVACTPTNLPASSALTTVNEKLPDPFKFYDGTRMTKKSQWECRRQEILDMASKYIYGPCPPKPDEVTGTVSGGSITINCKVGSKTASFTASVASGSGDVICLDLGTGITPGGTRALSLDGSGASKIKTLYGISEIIPSLAQAWQIDRVIEVLKLNPTSGLNPDKMMVSGCSGCGKGAFLVGAYSHIPLTVIVESGGGGAASWRQVEWFRHGDGGKIYKCADAKPQGIDNLEDSGICGPWVAGVASWVRNSAAKVKNLPFDQHELLACIAPRYCCHFTNQHGKDEWCHLGGTCEALSAWAAEPVWNALGVPENFGFLMYTEGSAPGHCSKPASATALASEFFKRAFQGDKTAKTDVMTFGKGDADLQQPQADWKAMWVDWDMNPTLE